MDQSSVLEGKEYGKCVKCKQLSTSLMCQTCDSYLKERKYGKCVGCKQIESINKGSNFCRYCNITYREIKYERCVECKQINTRQNWCLTCNSKRFQQKFNNWTSDNDAIDKFIQNNQLTANSQYQLLEWIPYDRFSEVKYIAKGGFGKVYKANWKDGYISHWDICRSKWQRYSTYVALKILDNSQRLTLDFINEITLNVKIFEDKPLNEFVRCYGISQDPSTKNYIMVMQYAKFGSLRNWFNYKRLSLKVLRKKILILGNIAAGLKRIHKKRLIHRDLHTGNILLQLLRSSTISCITDMGLCKPAADYKELESTKKKVYGVLPYMAPEVLRGEHYTQASDIYSFGIIMYEIISESSPYPNIDHNEYLAIEICRGLRPNFNTKMPQLILHLLKRCLDANPLNRPNAFDLSETFGKWTADFGKYKKKQTELIKTELIKQIKEIGDSLSTTNSTIKKHPGAIYTSRPFNFNNLPEPKNSDNYYENNDNISSMIYIEEPLESNSSRECLECEITN